MSAIVYIDPKIAAVRALYGPLLTPAFRSRPVREQLEAQATRLCEAHAADDPAVGFQIASWLPHSARLSLDEILSRPFGQEDARLTIAREYGYRDWAEVEAAGGAAPDAVFEVAVDAALGGDVNRLGGLLTVEPDLVSARSVFAHRAGLLHYMGANGVESWRQVTPLNGAAVITLLIDAGAKVNAEAPIYGGSRPLGLLETSGHPRAAGVGAAMAATLRAAGAY